MDNQHSAPKLLIRARDGSAEERELTQPEFTIGRKPDNDLVLDDATVSGHHAKITKIQAALFLEDLHSTNGTQVNGHPIDRRQLQDADVIAIGHFRLVFRGDQVANPPSPTAGTADHDQTMALTGHVIAEATKKQPTTGVLDVVAGKLGQDRYELTKHVTVIGSREDATVALTGWFKPKVAAMIARRGTTYILTPGASSRKVMINDEPAKGPMELEEGDRIEVAGIMLRFSLKAQKKAA